MLTSMKVRLATSEDKHLPAFDYTKLTAINTCPRWGLIRYDQHKKMPGEARAMPLEAGAAAHEAYSAIRMFQALTPHPDGELMHHVILSHMVRLLGEERTLKLYELYNSNEDERQRVNAMAIYALNTSGFYDDPSDKRRTMSNLEQSLIAYVDRLDLKRDIPIITDKLIGIEVPFDLVITLWSDDRDGLTQHADGSSYSFRYIGRMDGLMRDTTTNRPLVHENKTASRLDQAWHDSFVMSHQVTGYCVAATEILGEPVTDCTVLGMMTPLPKTYDLGGIAHNAVSRDEGRVAEWAKWLYSTIQIWAQYKDDPLNAPEYTHSCNRYFRSCSFIPLCAMTGEDRKQSYDEMVHDEWTPLDKESAVG